MAQVGIKKHVFPVEEEGCLQVVGENKTLDLAIVKSR